MQLRFVDSEPRAHETPLLAIPVPVGSDASSGALASVDELLGGDVADALASGDMRGKEGDAVVLRGDGEGPSRVVLLGMGEPEEVSAEKIRRFAGRAVRAAEELRLASVSVVLDGLDAVDDGEAAQAAAEGLGLAAWRFTELKNVEEEDDPPVRVRSGDILGPGDVDALGRGTVIGAAIARGANFARTLQARPGNVATPTHIAEEAERMAGSVGLDVTVFDEDRMRAEGMHALLSVSRGSAEEARLVILEHDGGEDGDPPLILVGKGLSFDAGGISLKPSAGMEDMKYDMSGGAAVIGAMQAIAELGVKANVVGIVPSSENLPSGTATKPGDVIQSLAGKTIEVINTDAEGRLILADALAWGARMKPAAMVDCATLTGSVIIALGHHAAAVMGNDEALVQELVAAGEASGERCWELPLWDEYRKQLDSECADLKNVGGRPGGSITAAAFLSEFVGDAPWAHLDVAGTAFGEGKLPYQRKGGVGFPTRLLVEWVRSRSG
ncbi:MAG: leucyl aminopeptidase [Longimicrobiales bacterium]|nr:leucyl aminopeptidase [Longimicrobiales bacterium]